MSSKAETNFQRRLQTLISKRGGYIPKKNHGDMITVKGLQDLPFTYKGFSMYWEVKAPKDPSPVSEAQGIHCRLAQKAGGVTAIISSMEQAELILNYIDYLFSTNVSMSSALEHLKVFYRERGLDDGTSY